MAIWYSDSGKWRKTSVGRENLGLDVYLYCPGPSLADVDPGLVHRPGCLVMALTTAYPRVRPDVWVGMDKPECYDERLWREPFVKICQRSRGNRAVTGQPIRENINTFFVDCVEGDVTDMFPPRKDSFNCLWAKSSIFAALHYATHIGAKRIHLVGCDMTPPDADGPDYHDDRVLTPDQRAYNRRFHGLLTTGLGRWADAARKHDVTVLSCTPDSPINEIMQYVPIDEALAASEAQPTGKTILHVKDVDKTPKRGVMTGCNAKMEWILQWWWDAYHAHNAYPVEFADFGMTAGARKWCARHGRVVDPECDIDADFRVNGVGTGAKPHAIALSGFDEVLWLDIDCEVRGSLDIPLSSLSVSCGRFDLTICEDLLYPHKYRANLDADEIMHNAGVMAIRKDSVVMRTWLELVKTGPHGWRKSDQPLLSKAICQNRDRVAVMDGRFNEMRSRNEATVFHWLTSHPAHLAELRKEVDKHGRLDGAWLRDSELFERTEWKNAPTAERGVVIGVDENQEWMLDWWWGNYSNHNSLPVMFADFGMSTAARAKCAEWGQVSERIALDGHGWFKKPLGCLVTPFRQTVWFDTDCEIRKAIDPLWGHLEGGKLGITVDRGTPQKWKDALPSGATVYNTGCIVYQHGEDLIRRWAQTVLLTKVLTAQEDKLLLPTGDQECFATTVQAYGAHRIREIPPSQFQLRIGADNAGACIAKHWTGPTGKNEIRRQIGRTEIVVDKSITPPTLETILDALPKGSIGAEIGVKEGYTSAKILDRVDPNRLYLIDPWECQNSGYDDVNNVPQDRQDARYETVRGMFKSDKRVVLCRGYSVDAAHAIPDGHLDWIFLDANHSYESVLLDLQTWSKKVGSDGLIWGHDYCNVKGFGVIQAVNEFCAERDWHIDVVTGTKYPYYVLCQKNQVLLNAGPKRRT